MGDINNGAMNINDQDFGKLNSSDVNKAETASQTTYNNTTIGETYKLGFVSFIDSFFTDHLQAAADETDGTDIFGYVGKYLNSGFRKTFIMKLEFTDGRDPEYHEVKFL